MRDCIFCSSYNWKWAWKVLYDTASCANFINSMLSVYILTSFFGFLLFGDLTLDNLLANFDTDLGIPYSFTLNDVVCISNTLYLMFVFPVIFYPLCLNLDGLLFLSARTLISNYYKFAFINVAFISDIFLGANFIPSI